MIEAVPLRYGDQRETIDTGVLQLVDINTKYISMFISHWFNKDQVTKNKFFGSSAAKTELEPILCLPFGGGSLKKVKIHKCFFDVENYKMMNSMYMHCFNI